MARDIQLRPELAAGGLLWRRQGNETEILIVHRPRYGDWAFPKGRLDQGESLLQCGIREVEEETGFVARVGRKLAQVAYRKPNGKQKKVALWAMTPVAGSFTPNHEVDKIKWLPIDRAAKRLTYKADRRLVEGLGKNWSQRPRRVILVRHAHAGDRHRWDGEDDARRPLSGKGIRQANWLATALTYFDIDRVLTSPATRCIDTIADIAAARRRRIQIEQSLWEDTPIEIAKEIIVAAKRGTTLLCSHGPIIAGLLRSLLGTRRAIPHEKGTAWVLDIRKGAVTDANYFAPRS